jgi:NADH pyrophosphatase NudC (nudix superfamily)
MDEQIFCIRCGNQSDDIYNGDYGPLCNECQDEFFDALAGEVE